MAANSQSTSKSGGIGFLGLLTILFIGLKLTNHIDWSWLWVLSPLWLPFAAIFGFLAASLLIAGLIALAAVIFDR